jgi:hypothetical protein
MLSACRACTGAVRAQAGEESTGGVGSGWPLGIKGGVQGMSRVRQQWEACLLCLSTLGCAWGWHLGFEEKGRGRARAVTGRWG